MNIRESEPKRKINYKLILSIVALTFSCFALGFQFFVANQHNETYKGQLQVVNFERDALNPATEDVPFLAHDGSWNYVCFNGHKVYNSDFSKSHPNAVDDVVPCDATNDFTVWKEHPIDCMKYAVEMDNAGNKKYLVNGVWSSLKC